MIKNLFKNSLFLLLLGIIIIYIISRVAISTIFDKSETSKINQISITPNSVSTKASDLSLNQALLYSDDFSSKGKLDLKRIENNYYVIFNKDFSIGFCPNPLVYLSQTQDYDSLDTSKTLNIGTLKSTSGAQAYEITEDQYKKYNGAVIIWCKLLGMHASIAKLV